MYCRYSKSSVFLTTLFVLVLFNEWLIYVWKSFTWPSISCKGSNNCSTILFIADPQILGENDENIFTRFDSDRYLRNTFTLALDYVKPNGLVFLGDLMDEGSKANDEQFARYCNRFYEIFQLFKLPEELKHNAIFIPGDNDIGGEGDEKIDVKNVNRFRNKFGKSDVQYIRNIKVLKMNRILRTYPVLEEESNKHTLNIIISHLPVTKYSEDLILKAVKQLNSRFIFSGHDHQSYAILSDPRIPDKVVHTELIYNYVLETASWVHRTDLYNVITEFVVPTCSYRMGTFSIGYGVLVYDASRERVFYSVLWLPERFLSLVLYSIFFIISIIYFSKSSIYRVTFRKPYVISKWRI